MTKRQQMLECIDAMQKGMERTATQRDMWQSELIWWMCKALCLLLERAVKAKEGDTDG